MATRAPCRRDCQIAPLSRLWASIGSEGLVDDVGKASFQDAKGFQAAVATGFPACYQVFRRLVTTGLGHRDAMQGGVELAVAGAAEPVASPVG